MIISMDYTYWTPWFSVKLTFTSIELMRMDMKFIYVSLSTGKITRPGVSSVVG